MTFSVKLTPNGKIPERFQQQFWRFFREDKFRTRLGKVDLDHLTEDHMQYVTPDDISINLFRSGRMHLYAEEFSVKKAVRFQRIVQELLRSMEGLLGSRFKYTMDVFLHLIVQNRRIVKFLNDNVRVATSPKLRKALNDYRGIFGFAVNTTENLRIYFWNPNDIDFQLIQPLRRGSHRKLILTSFVSRCMVYLNSLRRLS